MKIIKELHEKHNVYPEYKNFYLNYQYNFKKLDWEFIGYRCTKCFTLFKRPNTIVSHTDNCREIGRGRYKSTEIDKNAKVLTNSRHFWKPFEINQNFSNDQSNSI